LARALVRLAFGVVAASAILAAQTPPLVALRGVVVSDDGAAAPIRRIRVEVSATGLSADPAYTDDQGRFVVLVPDRAHTLAFSKPGFARQELRRSRAAADEVLTVRILRGGAIAGRVADEFGDPILARVRLQREDWETIVVTDPLGEFRVGSLNQGRYTVTVVGGFPSLAKPDTGRPPTTVDLGPGEEVFTSLSAAALGFASGTGDARLAATPAIEPDRQGEGGIVRGRIVGPNGLPVGGASVTIGRRGDAERRTVSDASGLYAFEGLPAGIFLLRAGKIGSSLFSESTDNTLTLRDGLVADPVNLVMAHPPVIGGIVTDEYGEPVEGITVQLWQPRSRGGRGVLMPSEILTARARTDDRGHYRLFATPGTFYVVAIDERLPHGSDNGSALRVYYPGSATLLGALPVRSEGGRDMAGVDIKLVAPATGRIEGRALDAAGRPLTAPVVLSERYWARVPTPPPRTAAVGPAGEFSFGTVPPGDYVLHAVVHARGGGAAEFAVTDITLADGETRSGTVRTSPGTTMTGRIVLEGDRQNVELWRFGLSAQSDDGDFINPRPGMSPALVHEDGTFEWAGLLGPLRITGNAPDGWWLKSVNIGVLDAAIQPYSFGDSGSLENVVAVFADTAGEINGRVVDRNEPVLAYAVLVFPTDRDRWSAASGHVKIAKPDPSGRFRALAMPPGDYLAAAVDRFDLDTEWLDPEILAELAPSARRVTVRERQPVTMELDLIRRQR
jgi:protocatechuate 3,4-dioxygenase beta subunit